MFSPPPLRRRGPLNVQSRVTSGLHGVRRGLHGVTRGLHGVTRGLHGVRRGLHGVTGFARLTGPGGVMGVG